MFTIEVKKIGKDEEFGFGDLEMFHQECYGGKIEQELEKNDHRWRCTCSRCGTTTSIYIGYEEGVLSVTKTAIDGEKRKLSGKDMFVIQKA